jgi:hypothetical protein
MNAAHERTDACLIPEQRVLCPGNAWDSHRIYNRPQRTQHTHTHTHPTELWLGTPLAIWFGNQGRAGNNINDKPGPVTSYRGGDPPQREAGLRGGDWLGAGHPGLRGWDNRSPGPVYGSPLAAAAAFS